MKRIPFFQIDAFADQLFKGNPGAVCPLEDWLPEDQMQKIAFENNLSETAFFVPHLDGFYIRWFTPNSEINLCGHGTVATAHALWHHLGYDKEIIKLYSKGGDLQVSQSLGKIYLNFPAIGLSPIASTADIEKAFGKNIEENYVGGNNAIVLVLSHETDVQNFVLQKALLLALPCRIAYITAKGSASDFVSRVFAPSMQIDEDPVTGSAHCALVPFWATRLGKTELFALQLSDRGGSLWCRHLGDRVEMGGYAVTFLVGEIWLK